VNCKTLFLQARAEAIDPVAAAVVDRNAKNSTNLRTTDCWLCPRATVMDKNASSTLAAPALRRASRSGVRKKLAAMEHDHLSAPGLHRRGASPIK